MTSARRAIDDVARRLADKHQTREQKPSPPARPRRRR